MTINGKNYRNARRRSHCYYGNSALEVLRQRAIQIHITFNGERWRWWLSRLLLFVYITCSARGSKRPSGLFIFDNKKLSFRRGTARRAIS